MFTILYFSILCIETYFIYMHLVYIVGPNEIIIKNLLLELLITICSLLLKIYK